MSICKQMVTSKGTVHPCGQCLFCRINHKRDWIARLLLEAACHEENQFWTLSYEDESLPTNLAPGRSGLSKTTDGLPESSRRAYLAIAAQAGTLFKPDLANFFKRLRKDGHKLRYYAIGEYGERLGRPHYHVLAFGIALSPAELAKHWGHGHIHIGDVESASINYCVEYALKFGKARALVDLRRIPEFSVCSKNPAIGSFALGPLRRAILASPPLPTGELLIPDSFRVSGRNYPVPRFLRNELEEEGFLSARKAVTAYWSDKEVLHALLARSPVAQAEFKKFEVLWSAEPHAVVEKQQNELRQKILNAETRQRIFGGRHETL